MQEINTDYFDMDTFAEKPTNPKILKLLDQQHFTDKRKVKFTQVPGGPAYFEDWAATNYIVGQHSTQMVEQRFLDAYAFLGYPGSPAQKPAQDATPKSAQTVTPKSAQSVAPKPAPKSTQSFAPKSAPKPAPKSTQSVSRSKAAFNSTENIFPQTSVKSAKTSDNQAGSSASRYQGQSQQPVAKKHGHTGDKYAPLYATNYLTPQLLAEVSQVKWAKYKRPVTYRKATGGTHQFEVWAHNSGVPVQPGPKAVLEVYYHVYEQAVKKQALKQQQAKQAAQNAQAKSQAETTKDTSAPASGDSSVSVSASSSVKSSASVSASSSVAAVPRRYVDDGHDPLNNRGHIHVQNVSTPAQQSLAEQAHDDDAVMDLFGVDDDGDGDVFGYDAPLGSDDISGMLDELVDNNDGNNSVDEDDFDVSGQNEYNDADFDEDDLDAFTEQMLNEVHQEDLDNGTAIDATDTNDETSGQAQMQELQASTTPESQVEQPLPEVLDLRGKVNVRGTYLKDDVLFKPLPKGMQKQYGPLIVSDLLVDSSDKVKVMMTRADLEQLREVFGERVVGDKFVEQMCMSHHKGGSGGMLYDIPNQDLQETYDKYSMTADGLYHPNTFKKWCAAKVYDAVVTKSGGIKQLNYKSLIAYHSLQSAIYNDDDSNEHNSLKDKKGKPLKPKRLPLIMRWYLYFATLTPSHDNKPLSRSSISNEMQAIRQSQDLQQALMAALMATNRQIDWNQFLSSQDGKQMMNIIENHRFDLTKPQETRRQTQITQAKDRRLRSSNWRPKQY